jgi:hypothetical protein
MGHGAQHSNTTAVNAIHHMATNRPKNTVRLAGKPTSGLDDIITTCWDRDLKCCCKCALAQVHVDCPSAHVTMTRRIRNGRGHGELAVSSRGWLGTDLCSILTYAFTARRREHVGPSGVSMIAIRQGSNTAAWRSGRVDVRRQQLPRCCGGELAYSPSAHHRGRRRRL